MEDIREKDTIEVEFTEELLDAWTKCYFKKHPRARKKPIEKSSHPSINKWCILRRISMNTLKQCWKDFTIFVVSQLELGGLGISKCKCKYIVYKGTQARSDIDNIVPKFLLDGLTAEASGLLVDDSSECITELTLKIEYRKGQTGAKLIFTDCEFDKDLLIKTREKEINKTYKREETKKLKKKKSQ